MWIEESVAALEGNGALPQVGGLTATGYFMFALIAVVVGLTVLVLIWSSFRKSSKR